MRLSLVRRVTCTAILGLSVQAVASAQVTTSGVGYLTYGYALKPDSGLVATTGNAGHDNNFDVARSYVNFQTKSANVATRVTIDVDGRTANATQLTFRAKYAYVAYTPDSSALTYKMGLIHTAWLDWEESLWDYRQQGTMAFERNKYGASADFGAGVDGTWHFDDVNMQAAVVNGENYNGTPGDQYKDFEARVSWRLWKSDLGTRSSGLRLTGYAQVGKSNGGGDRDRYIGMISYKSKMATLAAQVDMGQDSISAGHAQQKSRITSIYGVYNIPSTKAALIARMDTWDPNTDSVSTAKNATGSNTQTRYIFGGAYNVAANLRVLLDFDLNSLQNGSTNSFDKSRQMFFVHTQVTF